MEQRTRTLSGERLFSQTLTDSRINIETMSESEIKAKLQVKADEIVQDMLADFTRIINRLDLAAVNGSIKKIEQEPYSQRESAFNAEMRRNPSFGELVETLKGHGERIAGSSPPPPDDGDPDKAPWWKRLLGFLAEKWERIKKWWKKYIWDKYKEAIITALVFAGVAAAGLFITYVQVYAMHHLVAFLIP